jgi:hypothetical protein
LPQRPAGAHIFIRPNQYEAGRANIAIYNWGLKSVVDVDVSSILPIGARYEVRNAQSYFAQPVASGIYGGGSIPFSMAGVPPAAPIGDRAVQPATTGPEFDVFILTRIP